MTQDKLILYYTIIYTALYLIPFIITIKKEIDFSFSTFYFFIIFIFAIGLVIYFYLILFCAFLSLFIKNYILLQIILNIPMIIIAYIIIKLSINKQSKNSK